MLRFAPFIAEKWNISRNLAEEICRCWERGDTAHYLTDYHRILSVQLSADTIWEIADFLEEISALVPKQKRLINALRKAEALTPELEERISLTIDSFELDDLLIPYRLNPRSKGQLALQKGLGALADRIVGQSDEGVGLEELAAPFVGKHPSLTSEADVIAGVKDILVERFSSEDTVRAMVRDFGYDEGYFDVTPKKKGDKEFANYTGKTIYHRDLTPEENLSLIAADDEKRIRLKLGVQLFHIGELLRHHFVTNPDAAGFDLICEAIDESWSKCLQPMVESDVKARIRKEAEDLVVRTIGQSIMEAPKAPSGGPFAAIGLFNGVCSLIAVDSEGRFLGASSLGDCAADPKSAATRFRQFTTRYRPTHLIVAESEQAELLAPLLEVIAAEGQSGPQIIRQPVTENETALAASPWMVAEFKDLDEPMRNTLAVALSHVRPQALITRIGVRYFPIHPLQKIVSPERLDKIVNRKTVATGLAGGITIDRAAESVLALFQGISIDALREIQKRGKATVGSKEDIKGIPGVTEPMWRNIAGYIIIPNAANVLDRSLVHPEQFPWITRVCEELDISGEMLVQDPAVLRSSSIEDMDAKLYIEQKLISQLQAAQPYLNVPTAAAKRLKLNEITEGAIVPGRVTNIASFGVFVDINAVCDGLVHISQLADTFVESPEQVVSVGDRVNVRIVKVDTKKRRVSLSMKGLGNLAPKIRPSQGQLSTLADHFKNR